MKSTILRIIANRRIVLGLGEHAVVSRKQDASSERGMSDKYNNFVIVKMSFPHLVNNEDLSIVQPEGYWDLYKCTPTFAVLFRGLLCAA